MKGRSRCNDDDNGAGMRSHRIHTMAADGDDKKGASSRSMRVILAQVATLIFSVMIQVLCVEGRGGVVPHLPAP